MAACGVRRDCAPCIASKSSSRRLVKCSERTRLPTVANPLTAPSGMGAALALFLDASIVGLSGLSGGENDRGEDASMATRREGASYCGEAAGGLELNITTS